jgi:hypothetical protein
MYIFKNFPGEKPPDPRPTGRPRLTRGEMGMEEKEGRVREGKGKGRGKGLEIPHNLYAAYAHAANLCAALKKLNVSVICS